MELGHVDGLSSARGSTRAKSISTAVVFSAAIALGVGLVVYCGYPAHPVSPEQQLFSGVNGTSLFSVSHHEIGFVCRAITDGSCSILPCHRWRGPTTCENSVCFCKPGFCANEYGVCIDPNAPKCQKETGGTCRWSSCSASRGETDCKDHKCLCKDGYCAKKFNGGTCVKEDTCLANTAGSCLLTGCNVNRGPTNCQNRKCMCETGYCAQDNGAGYGVCQLKKSGQGYLANIVDVNQNGNPQFPAPQDNVKTALCFSGGGARAYSITVGAYRALEDLGLMPHVDAISCVSGGCWASSIYMFAEGSKEEILGAGTQPEDLTMDALGKQMSKMGYAMTRSAVPFIKTMTTLSLPSDEIWPMFVGNTVLSPFGLANRTGFMAATHEAVARIKQDNPDLAEQGFYVPRAGRPKVFVMSGTILAPLGFKADATNAVSFQMSPDYTGSPFWANDASLGYEPAKNGARKPVSGLWIGGFMVETFAFGGRPLLDSEKLSTGKRRIRPPIAPFSLMQAVGISSDAPAASLAAMGSMQFVVPQEDLWSIHGRAKGDGETFQLADGGNFENAGLVPAVQRGATKVIVWESVSTALPTDYDWCAPLPADVDWEAYFAKDACSSLSDKFGWPYQDKGNFYTKNQVFPKDDIFLVLCGLQTLHRAGKPTVYRSNRKVVSNTWWGIAGGQTVDLTIIYNEQCTDFEDRLPADTKKQLGPKLAANRTWKTSGEFARFPFYLTTKQTEELTEVTRLTMRETNLLSAQSEYFVKANEKLFQDVLCPPGFVGIGSCGNR